MNRHRLLVAALGASSLLSSQALLASPLALPAVHAMFGKTRMVSFSLRNDSASPLKIKAGDALMTIDPGKTMALKLPAGTSVTAQEATASREAGAVIAQVTGDLSGVTISLK